MAGLAIVVVAAFFGAVAFLASHALIVVPVMILAWALLLVGPKLAGRSRATAADKALKERAVRVRDARIANNERTREHAFAR